MKKLLFVFFGVIFFAHPVISEENPFFIKATVVAGLGNQMFRYASILSYALDKKLPVCLSVGKTPLLKFPNLINSCTTEQKNTKCSEVNEGKLLSGDIKTGACLQFSGYCQNPNYFINHEAEIRHAFEFPPLDEKNQKLAEKMQTENSISLHFRRGDYIRKGYPIPGLEYYQNAIKYITQKDHEPPHLYIFSNDIKWVKENFLTALPHTFIEGNDNLTDMNLMSKCRHNVIANSTFSWWGAWLNKTPNKIVIVPNRWDDWHPNWGKNILPKEWIVLEAHAYNFVKKK